MDKFVHKKSLGQNFLKDKNVLMKIIDSVDVQEDDLIIEIGPGQGALTKYLKLFHANLICYEVDNRVKRYLDSFVDTKTKIIYEDFLKRDVVTDISKIEYNNLYIVANLPYYITSPIIEKIIRLQLDVTNMVFMVQNEVADRFAAKPGSKDYGYMTVFLNYYYYIEKLFFVNRSCFNPVPNVDSAVIRFNKLSKKYEVKDEKLFFNIIRDAFHMKRKNLRNNLRNYDLEKIAEILEKYGLSLQDRAEKVSVECFVDISNELC
jgi:16S rRNA (adenine1518-N6/adenine1519-N6)-dimethyltransferase